MSGAISSIRAGSPKHVERADKGWIFEWPDGHTQIFDAVVCATGFYPPRFHATRDALSMALHKSNLKAKAPYDLEFRRCERTAGEREPPCG